MSFASLSFFLFAPVVWGAYQLTPDRLRWLVLLSASIGFYAFLKAPVLLLALAAVTLLAYCFGNRISQSQTARRKRQFLWIGITLNLLVLAAIKYWPSLRTVCQNLFHTQGGVPAVVLSIGVSYFTFQAISYLVDIYLEIAAPEPHLGRLALYFSFFPKLLQGPIERAADLLPQLKVPYQFNYYSMRSAMLLFAWGLFKKVVVADRLAAYVDPVYDHVYSHAGLPLLIATYFYAIQIYADFSGYTDMALGIGRIFNIRLTQNFQSPYLATSVADFWRRWHISFSRWILDYIFRPLQMQWRISRNFGTAAALLITFLLCGIWHGPTAGFIVWGLLHGIYLSVSVFLRPVQKRLHKAMGLERTLGLKVCQIVVTFHLVAFTWIFFRANSLDDALYVVTHLLTGMTAYFGNIMDMLQGQGNQKLLLQGILLGKGIDSLACAFFGILAMLLVQRYGSFIVAYHRPLWLRWSMYIVTVLVILFASMPAPSSFIYFQF